MTIDTEVADTSTFYIKECLGQYGRPIKIRKWRTMVSDDDLEDITNVEFDQYGHIKDDPRVTPQGRLLRKYWFDECPQFFSVLKRDLSLVGVRPMTEKEWEKYPLQLKEEALKKKPGLLGFQYAFTEQGDFNTHLEHMAQYLFERKVNPFRTYVRYMGKIIYNIIFKGVRSS